MTLNLTAYLNSRFQFSYDVTNYASIFTTLASAIWRFQVRPIAGSPIVALDFQTGGSPQSAEETITYIAGPPAIIVMRCPSTLLFGLLATTYSFDFGFTLPGFDFERVDGGTITFVAGVTITGLTRTPGAAPGSDDTVLGGAGAIAPPVPLTLLSAIGSAALSAVSAAASQNAAGLSALSATSASTAAIAAETAAGLSAVAAAGSASAAGTGGTTATTQASNAAASASAAASSQSAAISSAAAAAASATAAAASAASASTGGLTSAQIVTAGVFFEPVLVTAADTLAALSYTPNGTFALLFLNGQAFAPPAFSFAGTALTWNSASAGGVHLATSDSVSLFYSR